MKSLTPLATLLLLGLGPLLCRSQTAVTGKLTSVVFPQLNGILDFDTFTPAIQIQTNAGNYVSTKQFTIWGWFRQKDFYTFNSPSNIFTVQNVQNFSAQEVEIRPYPNPDYANCPYSLSELEAQPDLKELPDVKSNPNCFPLEITNDNIQNVIQESFAITNDEILFLNYLLSNYKADDISQSTYELQFYLKSGDFDPNGPGSMTLYTIKDLPFVRNLWTFWAVAANYETGELILYMRVFGPNGYERLQRESLSYPGFQMNQGSLLLIGATNKNRYFKTLTGYIGEVAYVQMSPYFLENVQHLWVSEMLVQDTLYDGVNAELLFDLYEKKGIIKSYGFNTQNVQIEGDYTPIYTQNKSLLGARFESGSSFSFADFKYRGSPFVSSHPFFFNFSYKEALPNEFILLEKGSPGQSGYLVFKLVKAEGGRRKLVIQARSANEDFEWQSPPSFKENTNYRMLAGIVVSANNTVHALMKLDGQPLQLSAGQVDFKEYDFSYKNIRGLKNPESYSGSITFHRLNVLDNFSGAILTDLELSNKRLQSLSANCLIRTDYFDQSFGCQTCKKGFVVIVATRTCAKFCPQGFRNNGVNVCVKCLYEDCSDLQALTWEVKVFDQKNNIYRLIPSRPIYPANVDFGKLLMLTIPGMEVGKDYNYTLTPGVNNEYVDVNFDFKKNVYGENANVKFEAAEDVTLFDQLGNKISGATFDFPLRNACKLADSTRKTISNLALAIFIISLVSIALALIVLCVCTKKLTGEDQLDQRAPVPKNELSNSIWKFLLHNWMKLQLVAFLVFLNTPFPCCLRIFLEQLYRYAVSWAHGMGPVWDSAHIGDSAYNNGLSNNLPPEFVSKFGENQGAVVKAFILHNMGVIFIFHLVVLVVYIIFQIIDCMLGTNENMFYKCFIVIHLNLIIVGYMLFHMMAFVFSFLNIAFALFTTPYFVMCFIIAVLYILGIR